MKYILLIFLLFLSNAIAGEPPVFVDDMIDAIALSEKSDKEILVVFTANWCKQCQIMKKDIQEDQEILSDKIVCYLNLDTNKELAKQYKVKLIPDYCLLRKRIQIKRAVGYTSKERFVKWLHNDN